MTELVLLAKSVTEYGRRRKQAKPQYDAEEKRFTGAEAFYNLKGQQLKGEPRILKKRECKGMLGYDWSSAKKWWVLSVIFIIQVSMNFNASVYGNANAGIASEFHVSQQAARTGQALFLIFYAIGSELWAPWSEELGRWPILQSSLLLVNLWQIPVAAAPNFASVLIGRILGGLSSAGGSVTLGMVNDMYDVDHQGYAVNYIVLSSVGGSVVGPVVGAFIEYGFPSWRWIFWISLFFGLFVQILHALTVPETSPHVIIAREAKRRREELCENVWGEEEVHGGMTLKKCFAIWGRPFEMFVREMIVLWLSLLSGFSDALIFTFIEAFTPVYAQYHFTTIELGLSFLPLLVGYFLAYLWFLPFIRHDNLKRERHPGSVQPESRLNGLLWTAPLLPIGLFIFAWTSLGPDHSPPIPWIAPMIASGAIGVANAAIYMSTIDFMIAAYGPYAASATGGNALARDALSGIAAWYSTPFYEYFAEPNTLSYPSTILACIATVFVIPVYIFYIYGERIREKSKFAQTLADQAKNEENNEETETPEEKHRYQDQESGARTTAMVEDVVHRDNNNSSGTSSTAHSPSVTPTSTQMRDKA